MFGKILIANRGEIACRVARTCRRMGVRTVAVYSEADLGSRHLDMADEAVCLGPGPAPQSYLDVEKVVDAARRTGAEAIHPGYGFLSENADFAERCGTAGIRFVGPSPEHIRLFGLKHEARALAEAASVPLLPGSGLVATVAEAVSAAEAVGYPVMLKSTAGGGGIGLRLCRNAAELEQQFDAVQRLSAGNFSHSGVFVERFVERARHIEVQVFGDGTGRICILGERDCSAQRRNQKVIEETPAPNLDPCLRAELFAAARRLMGTAHYKSAGTVEFVFDADRQEFFFLEVNTRLQVEHPVTEAVTGIDLIEWMLREATGELEIPDAVSASGWAIEARVYAEDPAKNFQPSAGRLTQAAFPSDARIETWVRAGTEVPPFYDPMLAKIIVRGDTREEAVARLSSALEETCIAGLETNLAYLRRIAAEPVFTAGEVVTATLGRIVHRPRTLDVLSPGTQTTVQDWPGRLGYWSVGVPPSGPMDPLAFRLANRLVGNPQRAAGLEITLAGPTLRFNADGLVALTGAPIPATLNGAPVPYWSPVPVRAGQTLAFGTLGPTEDGGGARAYLAVRGGIDVPDYLGSKVTFTLGRFGGHAGRALLAGDVLPIGAEPKQTPVAASVPETSQPRYPLHWEIGVLYGPHAAPDFFTPEDIDTFFETDWEVHFNSARTGIRLIGPKPAWARRDGGEAGLHPSNIHDTPYAIGAVDFTGDTPVILGPDGPSLGGFVCPVTVASAELWKMGQLRTGNRVRFVPITIEQARDRLLEQETWIADPARPLAALEASPRPDACGSAVLHTSSANEDRPCVVYRRSGDSNLLIEYGPPVLDFTLRFRVHALMEWIARAGLAGVIDVTPGIRSLQVHFDPLVLSPAELLDSLRDAESALPSVEEIEVPTRIVHLPLAWDDSQTRLAVERYMRGVRADAPWCPSNIEFIRRVNGLDSVEDVKQIVYDASYLVLGLGDVYLGAPVAVPVDPRHRLVTTKYNPARTWTPENAVGIGGAYLCVYGMEGPGGYQFVGRTSQVWNTFALGPNFRSGDPWLLRFFDQIRFFEVSEAELLAFRNDFQNGRARIEVEEGTFRLKDYLSFLPDHAGEIEAVRARRAAAFGQERERWAAMEPSDAEPAFLPPDKSDVPPGATAIPSPVAGSVWQVLVGPGDPIEAGQVLAIVESMKMEIPVPAPASGTVHALPCPPGNMIAAGQTIAVIL